MTLMVSRTWLYLLSHFQPARRRRKRRCSLVVAGLRVGIGIGWPDWAVGMGLSLYPVLDRSPSHGAFCFLHVIDVAYYFILILCMIWSSLYILGNAPCSLLVPFGFSFYLFTSFRKKKLSFRGRGVKTQTVYPIAMKLDSHLPKIHRRL